MMSLSNKNFKIASVKLTGPFHLQKKMDCQDFCAYKRSKNKLVAIISDGAGSVKYGKIGAKILCTTLCDILMLSDFKNIKNDIVFAIETAREKILNHRFNPSKSEKHLMTFSATLVGFVAYKKTGLFFHIGDGAAIAFFNNNLDSFVISKPENGMFSCETFFYTMPDWKNNLKFMEFKNAKQICLMTDGVTNFALKNNEIDKKFINPILSFLNNECVRKKAEKTLFNTLNSAQAKKINSDDKTFIWIRL